MTRRSRLPRTGTININNPSERNYWCDYFDLSANQLRDVINNIGNSVEDIRRHLGRPTRKKG